MLARRDGFSPHCHPRNMRAAVYQHVNVWVISRIRSAIHLAFSTYQNCKRLVGLRKVPIRCLACLPFRGTNSSTPSLEEISKISKFTKAAITITQRSVHCKLIGGVSSGPTCTHAQALAFTISACLYAQAHKNTYK